MNAIEQWKASGSVYSQGVALYATMPLHNKLLLKSFQRTKSAKLLEKLKYELSKIDKASKVVLNDKNAIQLKKEVVRQNLSKIEVVQYIEQQQNTYATKQALYFHELPEELRPTLLEANTLFKEMCFLKVALNELPDDDESKALEIQLQIASKQKKNAFCWQKIDYWKQYKIIPQPPKSKFETLTPANLVKQEQYLFVAISKMKKRLEVNNKLLLETETLIEINKIKRAIVKQECSLMSKNEELLKIKDLINGEG